MNSLLSAVFARLKAAVFQRRADGLFELISQPPAWLIDVLGSTQPAHEPMPLNGWFTFLDYFLADAEAYWKSPTEEPLLSDPWEEADPAGRPRRMQATALALDGAAVLILQSEGDLQQQFRVQHEQARANLLVNEFLESEVRRRTADIRHREQEIALRLVAASEYRDVDTGAHVRRIGAYAAALAQTLGWASEAIAEIRLAAPMHDVGKIGIPDGILLKPGRLTELEFATMQRHTLIGASILGGTTIRLLEAAQEIALAHHERWDGTGYPHRLVREAIPLAARLVAVTDVYDALIHRRTYKPALSEEKAIAILRAGRGSHFDPTVLDCFLDLLPTIRRIRDEFPESGLPE